MKVELVKIIFFVLIGITILSFPLTFIEDNGIRLFQISYYRCGIIIYKTTIDISDLVILPGVKKVITKKEGCFYFADDGKIYFRSNPREFNWYRLRTMFPFKATASINDNDHLMVVVRLPIGPTVLSMGFSLLGMLLAPAAGLAGIGFAIIPWLLFLVSYTVEKGRMETMVIELKEILADHNNQKYSPT
jgi:hypothetical protein